MIILLPFLLLIVAMKQEVIGMNWSLALLLFYAFIYRGITDFYRLKSKNVLNNNEFLKVLVPGSRIKYFKELYFL